MSARKWKMCNAILNYKLIESNTERNGDRRIPTYIPSAYVSRINLQHFSPEAMSHCTVKADYTSTAGPSWKSGACATARSLPTLWARKLGDKHYVRRVGRPRVDWVTQVWQEGVRAMASNELHRNLTKKTDDARYEWMQKPQEAFVYATTGALDFILLLDFLYRLHSLILP